MVRAFRDIAPFFTDTALPAELIEKMGKEQDVRRRLLWFRLFSVAMEQTAMTAGESDRLWRDAADCLFVGGHSPGWLANSSSWDGDNREPEAFWNARRKLAEYAPEDIRQKLEIAPGRLEHEEHGSPEPFLDLDELTERVSSEEGYYLEPDVSEIKETLKNATADKRAVLARAILGRLIRQDSHAAKAEEYYSLIELGDIKLPEFGLMREMEERGTQCQRVIFGRLRMFLRGRRRVGCDGFRRCSTDDPGYCGQHGRVARSDGHRRLGQDADESGAEAVEGRCSGTCPTNRAAIRDVSRREQSSEHAPRVSQSGRARHRSHRS